MNSLKIRPENSSESRSNRAARSSPVFNFEDLHILIVDDNPTYVDLLHGMLRAFGVTHIGHASSGRDAFSLLQKSDRVVDCILCDYTMEDGNGFQLLHAIRMGKIKYLRPDVCFLIMSATCDHETVSLAASLDANGYLKKPVQPEKLRAAILAGRARPVCIDFHRYSQVVVPEI